MSCQENDIIYENALSHYWDLLENYDFKFLIYANFLKSHDQWLEKEYGFSETPYDNAFDICWKWDCEGMSHDIEGTVIKYLMRNMNDEKTI